MWSILDIGKESFDKQEFTGGSYIPRIFEVVPVKIEQEEKEHNNFTWFGYKRLHPQSLSHFSILQYKSLQQSLVYFAFDVAVWLCWFGWCTCLISLIFNTPPQVGVDIQDTQLTKEGMQLVIAQVLWWINMLEKMEKMLSNKLKKCCRKKERD